MRSNRPLARPFQKWVCNVIETISNKGVYDLNEKISQLKGENMLLQQFKDSVEVDHHNRLIDVHKNLSLVYIGKIRIENDVTLIKIGSTKDIASRASSLKSQFGSCTFLKVYPCDDFEDFENFLQTHGDMKPLQFKGEVLPGVRSREVFWMSDEQIKKLYIIASRNVKRYALGHGKNGYQELRRVIDAFIDNRLPTQDEQLLTEQSLIAARLEDKQALINVKDTGMIKAFDGRTVEHIKKAKDILEFTESKLSDVVCALAIVTGFAMIEIFKDNIIMLSPSKACVERRASKRSHEGDHISTLLIPSSIIDYGLKRVRLGMPVGNMTNREVNQKYSSPVNAAARRFLGNNKATFTDLRAEYNIACCSSSNKKRRLN